MKQNKSIVLAAMDDESKVALLLSKQDLEDLIAALLDYEVKRGLPRWEPHKKRCKDLADGMRQLLREAFPTNQKLSHDA